MGKIRSRDEAERQWNTAWGMVKFCRLEGSNPKKYLRQLGEVVEYYEKTDDDYAFTFRKMYERRLNGE